jgi:hypothetical protein
LPFGTLEAGSNEELPLVGDVEFIAAAIGRTRKLYLIVDRESIRDGVEIWWWKIYWRRGGGMYLLVTVHTDDPYLMVV